MVPNIGNRTISVVVKDKEHTLFEGNVQAITSNNERGIFDVLPLHENFISVVKDFIRLHKTDGKVQDIKIGSGVIKVTKNQAHVYVGFET